LPTRGVEQFGAFLAAEGMPRQVVHIKREHVEAFIDDQLARFKATALCETALARVPGCFDSLRSA
jgi:hypothetical protein